MQQSGGVAERSELVISMIASGNHTIAHVACHRLDGGNTTVFAAGKNASRFPLPAPKKAPPEGGAFLLHKEK